MKSCSNPECPEDNPQPLTNFHKQSMGKHGRNARCRVCVTKAQVDREKNNPQTMRRRRNSHYLREYGITLEEYESMLELQDYKCKICGAEDSGHPHTDNLVVDHCHQTGVVRGLLCNSCNRGIGIMNEDPERMMTAAMYLVVDG